MRVLNYESDYGHRRFNEKPIKELILTFILIVISVIIILS